jgi:hypothetical protein
MARQASRPSEVTAGPDEGKLGARISSPCPCLSTGRMAAPEVSSTLIGLKQREGQQ